MLYNLSLQPGILSSILSEIRDKEIQKDRSRFRHNLERAGEIIAYEISKTLEYRTQIIETPLGKAEGAVLTENPILVTVLRAGLPFHAGFLRIFDRSDNGFIYAFRKHHQDGSFDILDGYITCPPLDQQTVIVADPMLASGASLISAIHQLEKFGKPRKLILASLIAASPGIARIRELYPDLEIWTATVDPELDLHSYIVPGLGDAGDLAFGEKMQR